MISLISQNEGRLSSLLSNIDRSQKLMNMRQKWLNKRRIGCNGEFKGLINKLKLDDEILDANVLDIDRNVTKFILIIH